MRHSHGAQIEPNACIGENTIIDSNAIVQNSIVLPGTLVGRNTSLDRVAVDGGLLMDIQRGCRVNVSDSFILSDLAWRAKKATIGERIAAILLFAFISPLVALSRIDWTTVEAHDGRGGQLRLKTGVNGRLLCRRWHWLKEVFKGRMRLIGILPRPLEWDIENDRELGQRLKESSPGLFSLADLHGCHEASDANEWVHASYQALEAENISRMIRSNSGNSPSNGSPKSMIRLQYSNSSHCNVPADLENVSRVSNLLKEYCELSCWTLYGLPELGLQPQQRYRTRLPKDPEELYS